MIFLNNRSSRSTSIVSCLAAGVKNTNGNKSFEFVPILPRQANLTWCQATVIVAGHPAFPLLALCSCSRPLPSVATFYSGNFRFSFRHPCGSLPGVSGSSPSGCLTLRWLALRVLPPSCDFGFHRKLPATYAAFCLTLEASTS